MNQNKKISIKSNKIGGNGYSFNISEAISGRPAVLKYTSNCQPVFRGDLLQNGGKKDCGCGLNESSKKDPLLFDMILNELKNNNKQTGGGNSILNKEISQFNSIKAVAEILKPLSPKELLAIPITILQDSIIQKKSDSKLEFEQTGGYTSGFQDLIAPLGHNNLLVLAALLLLHYFAVKNSKSKSKSLDKENSKKGGFDVCATLKNVLAPLGINALGASVFLVLLEESFAGKFKKSQSGGNPLKNLIAPLGTEAFIATGLLVILEKMFIDTIKETKTKDINKKKLIGGRLNRQYEKLFNMVAPLSFNAFAKKSFLDNFEKINKDKENK